MSQLAVLWLVTVACILSAITAQEGSAPLESGAGDITYRWKTEEYSFCSQTCAGIQTRRVYCQATVANFDPSVADDVECERDDVRLKPMEQRSCGVECPSYSYNWITYPYSDCNTLCGPGVQSRHVVCQGVSLAGTVITATDADCVGKDTKPITTRNCVSQCDYSTGDWSDCSVTCGGGSRTRSLSCVKTNENGTQQTVFISDCDNDPSIGDQPAINDTCNTDPCCTYRWNVTRYGACSQSCDGIQTRRVFCSCNLSDGQSAEESDESLCYGSDPRPKPTEEQSCGVECAYYTWVKGGWNACSVECGQGIKRRRVTCQETTLTSNFTVADSLCLDNVGRKPKVNRTCQKTCQCVASDWSPCSTSCGCGQQTRSFSCVKPTDAGGQRTVAFTHCEHDPTQQCVSQEQRQCEVLCYSWDPQTWGACSTLCGFGNETRNVPCVRQGCDGETKLDDTECKKQLTVLKPDTTRQCNPRCEYEATEWSPCSRSCGRGTQTRTVRCTRILISGETEVVPIGNCNSDSTITGSRPPASMTSCVQAGCPIPPIIRDPPRRLPSDYIPPNSDVDYYIRQPLYVIEGNRVSIDCTELEAEPLAAMWVELLDGTQLAPGERSGRFRAVRYGDRNITLIIDDVRISDEGNYKCVSQNTLNGAIIGTDTADSHLTVYKRPVVTATIANVDGKPVVTGSGTVPVVPVAADVDVLLACQAAIGRPPPEVKWYVGEIEIRTHGRFFVQADGSLLIKTVRESDTGNYRCEATNIVGKDDSSMSLSVAALAQTWTLIPGRCSRSCGAHGTQVIHPECVRGTNKEIVDDSLCAGQQKPNARREQCNRTPCLAHWATGPYGSCSSTCGGEQMRDVFCQQEQADGRTIKVPDSVCDRDDQRLKPFSSRSCGVECADYRWKSEEYGECSVNCGEGIQVRVFLCVKVSSISMVRVSDRECTNRGLSRPATSRSCEPDNVCYYNLTAWSDCSTSCGEGVQTRAAICIKSTDLGKKVIPLDECTGDISLLTPRTARPCYRDCRCVLRSWQAGTWSPCPVSCGSSTALQERYVYCLCFGGGKPTRVVDDSECIQLQKPNSSRECGRSDCPCVDQYWRKGPYDDCTPSCGDNGVRRRKVECVCFLNGVRRVTDPLQCDQNRRPVDRRDCYPPPCPCIDPRWDTDSYGSCSKTCNGIQTRTVNCVCNNMGIVDDGVCIAQLPSLKPAGQRSCLDECPCVKHYYSVSDWSYCSVTCGVGVQTRRVACYCARVNVYEEVTEKDVCEDAIGEPFPISEKPCFTRCPCKNLTYVAGPWTPCMPDECDGYQTRSLNCYCDDLRTDIRNCDFKLFNRPPETKRCHHCPFIWKPGNWSACSTKCRRRRTVLCKNAETEEMAPKSYCHAHSTMARPPHSERCEYEGNKTKITWEVSTWSPCSMPCSTKKRSGVKRRTVTCVEQCRRVKADGCNSQSKPPNVMQCTSFPCGTAQCTDTKGWNCGFVRKINLCIDPNWNYRCCKSCASGL